MAHVAFVSACTAVLALAGHVLGVTIHGNGVAALLPAVAGGAGGFGIGCACLDVARRWRMSSGRI